MAEFDGEIEHLPAWGCVVRSRTTSTDVVCFQSRHGRLGRVVCFCCCGWWCALPIVWVVLLFVRARRKRFYFVLPFSYRTVRSIINWWIGQLMASSCIVGGTWVSGDGPRMKQCHNRLFILVLMLFRHATRNVMCILQLYAIEVHFGGFGGYRLSR